MKKIILFVSLALLAACTPATTDEGIAISNTNVAISAPASDCGIASNTLVDEKLLFAAETGYNIPADAYVRAIPIAATKAARAKAQPLLVEAYRYLKLARTAYAAGDGCSLKLYSDAAKAFGDRAKALLPK